MRTMICSSRKSVSMAPSLPTPPCIRRRLPSGRHRVDRACRDPWDLLAALVGALARHPQRLGVPPGPPPRRAEVEQHAPLQPRHRLREGEEILVARLADGGPVAAGVL